LCFLPRLAIAVHSWSEMFGNAARIACGSSLPALLRSLLVGFFYL